MARGYLCKKPYLFVLAYRLLLFFSLLSLPFSLPTHCVQCLLRWVCVFLDSSQKLTRAVWFSSPYSTSFNITSLTMYIRSLYELGEPDIFITLFSCLSSLR